MTPKLKKIILLLLGAIVLFVVYAIFIKKTPTADPLVNKGNNKASADAQAIGNQISQALLKIEQIKLDKSVFTNEIYKTLVDRSEPITEEPIGRSNPFAPIGSININSSLRSSTSSTSTKTTVIPSTSVAPPPSAFTPSAPGGTPIIPSGIPVN